MNDAAHCDRGAGQATAPRILDGQLLKDASRSVLIRSGVRHRYAMRIAGMGDELGALQLPADLLPVIAIGTT